MGSSLNGSYMAGAWARGCVGLCECEQDRIVRGRGGRGRGESWAGGKCVRASAFFRARSGVPALKMRLCSRPSDPKHCPTKRWRKAGTEGGREGWNAAHAGPRRRELSVGHPAGHTCRQRDKADCGRVGGRDHGRHQGEGRRTLSDRRRSISSYRATAASPSSTVTPNLRTALAGRGFPFFHRQDRIAGGCPSRAGRVSVPLPFSESLAQAPS